MKQKEGQKDEDMGVEIPDIDDILAKPNKKKAGMQYYYSSLFHESISCWIVILFIILLDVTSKKVVPVMPYFTQRFILFLLYNIDLMGKKLLLVVIGSANTVP